MPFAICKKRGKMLYIEQSIKKYLEDLSAKLPAPGGGSVAALTGALAGGLISMVCNFTIGNPKFPDLQQNECMGILSSAGSVREELCRLIDEDVRVYGKVSIAYKLPKDTEEQKAKRAIVIQEVLKEAMQVPEQILKLSYPHIGERLGKRDHTTAIHSCEKVARDINRNAAFNQKIMMIKEKIYKMS